MTSPADQPTNELLVIYGLTPEKLNDAESILANLTAAYARHFTQCIGREQDRQWAHECFTRRKQLMAVRSLLIDAAEQMTK